MFTIQKCGFSSNDRGCCLERRSLPKLERVVTLKMAIAWLGHAAVNHQHRSELSIFEKKGATFSCKYQAVLNPVIPPPTMTTCF